MPARAGSAYIDFRADFSKLRRELAAEMAKLRKERFEIKGDLGIDTRGFLAEIKSARAVAKTLAKDPIEQRFVGEVERGGWVEFEALNDKSYREVQARKIEQKLGLKVDKKSILTGLQEINQVRAEVERRAGIEEVIRLRLGVEVDEAQIGAAVKQAEADIDRSGPVKKEVKFELDDASRAHVKAAIDDIERKAAGIRTIKTDYKVDTRTATAAFASLNREAGGTNRNLNQATRSAVGATGAFGLLAKSTTSLVGGMFQFKTRIPLVQLAVFGKILYTAAGGAISLAGALAPLTGLLGAIGPLASSAFQGIKTIGLATAGIGDAVKAAFSEQDKSAAGATSSMAAVTGAAEAVRAATVSLGDAERTQRFAVEDLTRAREEGTRQIEDMRAAVRSLALEEEGATLGLKEAKQALNQLVSEGADQLEVDRAVLRVKEARSELQKTRREGQRTRSDLGAVGAAGGVKGLPQVVQARRSLADANRGVAEAERELAAAAKRSSEALAGGGAAADAAAQKLAKLPPAAQDYVKFIIGLRPKIKQLQATAAEGLLPGVQQGIQEAIRNFPVLDKIIAGTSKVLGDLAAQAGRGLGSQEWGKDLEVQGRRNEVTIGRLGAAGLNLAEAFKDVTLAAGPLVDRLTKWVVALTDGWKESANAARESGRLQAFFKDAGDTFFKTVHILRDLAVSFKNIGSAARQAFGNELLRNIERGAANLREWTSSVQGQREMVGVFRDIGDNLKAVGRFIEDLSQDFRRLREEGNTTGQALSHIFIDLLEDLVAQAAESGTKLAFAFVKGWLKADILGKAFGAAFLIQRFGGPAAWAAIGSRVGAAFGLGVTTGAAGSVAATGGMSAIIGGTAATATASTAAAAGVTAGAAAGGGLLAGLRQKVTGSGIGKSLSPGLKAGGLGAAVLFAEPFLKGVLEKIDRGFEGSVGNTLRRTLGDKLGSIVSTALKTFTPGGLIRAPKNLFNLGKDLFGFGEQKDEVSGQVRELRDKVQALFGKGAKLKLDIETVGGQRDFAKIETNFNRLKNRLAGDAKSIAQVSRTQLGLMARYMDLESTAGQKAVTKNMRLTLRAINASLNTGASSAKASMRAIRQTFLVNSAASKDTAQKNFGLARDAIKAAVDSSKITARQGLKVIRGLFVDYLGTFGIKGRAAEIYLRNVPKTSGGGGKKGGVPLNYARGGLVQFGGAGQAGPDNIPVNFGGQKIAVGSGEVGAVFNRHQLPVLNARLSDLGGLPGFFNRFNRKHSAAGGGLIGGASRFATGGIVALGRKLQREGYEVGEHPAFGGVAPVHTSTSYHYKGMALDINDDSPPFASGSGEPGSLDKLYARLKRLPGVLELLWRVKDHFNHLHVAMGGSGDLGALGALQKIQKIGKINIGGPDSALKAGVQTGLERSRDAANQALTAAAESMSMEGAEPGVVGVGPKKGAASRSQMVRWAKTALEQTAIFPASAENIEKILTLAMKESSWITDSINLWDSNAAAGNPSGGLMHITLDKVGGSYKRLYDPVDNIATSIRYQKSRYGELVTHSPYAKGGLVDPSQAMQMLAPGGLVQPLRKTLRRVTKGATKKKRSKALDAFKRKIGKLGLPDKLQTAILGQLEQHERFSDLATRAQGLSTEDENTGVAQLAKVGGKNEGGWLVDDLSVLTALRNNLLKVRKIILERHAKLGAALKLAQERLKKLSKKGTTPRKWKGLNPAKDPIAKWNKQPVDKRQKRVKEWHKQHGSLPGDREFAKDGKLLVGPGRRKSALENIVTSLKTQRNKLLNEPDVGLGTYGSSGTGMLATLFAVQGYPASGDLFKRHMTLPPIGEFGGHIGDAQTALAALGESLRARPDSAASSDVFDSGRGERLEELLRLERQRTLVRDIEVAELLRSARQPPFAGAFATGGTVPGPVGAARTAIVHGGETITPPGQDNGRFRLVVEDHRVRVYRNDVEMIVDQKLRGVSRGVGRVPGLAGSLKP